MAINKSRFIRLIEKISKDKDFLYRNRVDDIIFSYVDIKKIRNKDKYDIKVSLDTPEVSIGLVKELIEMVCEEMGIIEYNITISI